MKQRVAPSTLARLASLQGLPTSVLQSLAQCATVQRYERGQSLVEHNDQSRDVYVILAGAVRVSLVGATGRVLTYQILPAGEMFGEVAAVDGLPRTASVLAEEDTVVARIAAADFSGLTRGSAEFANVIMQRLTRLNRWLTERLFEYHTYDVRGRVYAELLRLTEGQRNDSVLITDRDMASRVGTTRENVSRIHAALRRDGLIERDRSVLRLLNRVELETLLASCEFS